MPVTSNEAYEKLKEVLGLPDELVKCDIHLRPNDIVRITNCEFYAHDRTQTKPVIVEISGRASDDIIKRAIEAGINSND